MRNRRSLGIVLLLSLLWGSEWLFDGLLAGIPRFRVLGIRFMIASAMFVPFALRERNLAWAKLSGILAWNICLAAAIMVFPAVFLDIQTGISPGLAAIIFAMLPILASVFEGAGGLSDSPTLLGGLAGTAFLVRGGLSLGVSQTVPALCLLLIVMAQALTLVFAKSWLRHEQLRTSLLIQMLSASAIFFGYSAWHGRGSAPWTITSTVAVISLGLFGSAIAYFLFYSCLLEENAVSVSVIQWLLPVVGISETSLVFHHLPPWDAVAGGLLAIACVLITLRSGADTDRPLTLRITDDRTA